MSTRLELLGIPRMGQTDLPLDKPASLLYYLAARGGWVGRGELAFLYRPDAPEEVALSNVRLLLHRAKKLEWASGLEAEKTRVRLQLPTDLQEFRQRFESAQWDQAMQLYGGTFLQGLQLPDVPSYGAWLELERQELQQKWRTAVLNVCRDWLQTARFAQAAPWLERLLKTDPLDEEAVQLYLQTLQAQNKRGQAAEVYQHFALELRRELGVEPLESTRALVQPAQEPAPKPRHNLPTPSTRFVGRKGELQAIAGQLAKPECRLLTLVALGGTGKTRLALEVLAQQSEHFADGVWWVPLAEVDAPGLLVPSIAAALGLSFAGPADPKGQLFNFLREKELLLLLDNLEQLREGALLLEELLEAAPKIKLLTTSRVALELPSEWPFDLEGLAYAPIGTSEALEGFDAVRLFLARAERWSGEQLDLEEVAALCRQVLGMPLALELAAAWLRGLSLAQLQKTLAHNLDGLQATSPNVPERQRSVRAVLEYSWAQLQPAEQAVLARLALFRGGFSLEAAQQIAQAHLGFLLRFMNLALLRRGSDGRYDLHELVRQFAAAKLEADPAYEDLLAAHAIHYAHWLQSLTPQIRSADTLSLRAMEAELGNLRAAWLHLGQCKMLEGIAAAKDAFLDYWFIKGMFQEGGKRVGEMLEQLQSAHQPNGEALKADLLRAQGLFLQSRGQLAEAEASYQQALELAERQGLSAVKAEVSRLLGGIAHFKGEFAQAQRLHQQALELFQQVDDQRGMAYTHNALGLLAKVQGDYPQAQAYLRQSLELFQQTGDRRGLATASNNLGNVLESLGQYAEAVAQYGQCLEVFEAQGYTRGIAVTKTNLGYLAWKLGRLEEAERYSLEALEIKRQMGDRRGRAVTLCNLGEICLSGRELGRSRGYFLEALELTLAGKWATTLTEVLAGLSELSLQQGDALLAAQLAQTVNTHPSSSDSAKARVLPLLRQLDAPLPSLEQLLAALTP